MKNITLKTQLKNFLKKHNFGDKIFNEYYGSSNIDGYNRDLNKFNTAFKRAVEVINQLKPITPDQLEDATKRAFSGRLSYNGKFSYCAGQFYDVEIPHAVLAVAEYIQKLQSNNL